MIDLIGQRFGRLLCTSRDRKDAKGRTFFRFQCDCGKTHVTEAWKAKSGHTRSCGCFKREVAALRLKTHGMTNTYEYGIWNSMRMRCYNKNAISYPNYGARGITVCDRWRESFEAFISDMGPRPTDRHSVERINNDGQYSPENCLWIPLQEQVRNRRNTLRLEFDGALRSTGEIYEIAKPQINFPTFRSRLRRGWGVKDALEKPLIARGGFR